MKKITLTQGQVALVDDADFDWLSRRKWFAHRKKTRPGSTYYARSSTGGNFLMHRVILGLKHGDARQCDHVDGDGLNNQRSNLRVCTGSQNQHNQRPQKGGSSQYKGVSRDRETGKWAAQIRGDKVSDCHRRGKLIFLGYFEAEIDAARCYDKAAMKYHGEFARPNFTDRRG